MNLLAQTQTLTLNRSEIERFYVLENYRGLQTPLPAGARTRVRGRPALDFFKYIYNFQINRKTLPVQFSFFRYNQRPECFHSVSNAFRYVYLFECLTGTFFRLIQNC